MLSLSVIFLYECLISGTPYGSFYEYITTHGHIGYLLLDFVLAAICDQVIFTTTSIKIRPIAKFVMVFGISFQIMFLVYTIIMVCLLMSEETSRFLSTKNPI
jgi:hypothetical protein